MPNITLCFFCHRKYTTLSNSVNNRKLLKCQEKIVYTRILSMAAVAQIRYIKIYIHTV